MKVSLAAGVQGTAEHRVVSENLVSFFHAAGPPVLGSPFLLMILEHAAFNALLPHLDPGEQSVGVGFDFQHLAPTPAGMRVYARAEVTGVRGNIITLDFEARDEHEVIGRGKHVRAVIEMARFKERLKRKLDGE